MTNQPSNNSLLPHAHAGAVRFTFESAATAHSVAVAGTFNSWVGDAHPLARIGPTTWQASVAMPAGRHHYKYVIDGRDWIPDPANPWISEDAQNNSCLTLHASGEVMVRQGEVTRATPGRLYSARQALTSPPWLEDAVIYQLSVRAFGGTLDGMMARLDYLHTLGVNTVWLMPVHPIGVGRRIGALGDPYAVRDFLSVDPALGTAAQLRALVDAMHARGMRVIMDWTLNRSSCDNPLTVLHPDWFARDAQGQPCYLVPQRDHFAGFDFNNRAARAWLIDAMLAWLDEIGFDGMRFDDADITPTDFLDEIRAALVARHPDIALISQSCDEYHHLAACDLTYDGGVRAVLKQIAMGAAKADALRDYWEASTFSFPRGAQRMRWLEEKEQGRAHVFFGAALHLAAATVLLTFDAVPHILMGQEFNDGRWKNWESLFDPFALDWEGFDNETFSHYQSLIGLRSRHQCLRRGAVEFIESGVDGLVVYARSMVTERVVVAVNLRADSVALPAYLVGSKALYARSFDGERLGAYGCLVLK